MKRKIVIGVLVVFAFLALAAVRVVVSSRKEHIRGGRALDQGDMKKAIIHFRRSARWYAPGNPYVLRSYKKLWYLGREAERRGDRETALSAFRSIRGAILGCRSFYTPHSEWLPRVNRHIAQLMAAQQVKRGLSKELVKHHPAFEGGKSRGKGGEADGVDGAGRRSKKSRKKGNERGEELAPQEGRKRLEEWHFTQLQKTTAPSVGWSILALLGLALWIGGGFAFAYRAITPEDKIAPRRAIIYGVLIVIGLLVWMMGLSLA